MKEILSAIESVLDAKRSAVLFNMTNVLRGLLWDIVIDGENEKPIRVGQAIDNIVRIIYDTSRYTDRADGENYPIWENQKVEKELMVFEKYLIKKGFEDIRI